MSQKAKIIAIVAGIITILLVGGAALLMGSGKKQSPQYKVNLEIWGVFDDSSSLTKAIEEYRKINTHVGEIRYRKFTPDTYKTDLLDALASGKGPDIFMVNNTWMSSFSDKIESVPNNIIKEQEFRENFVDVVASDFIVKNKIYAVPLSVDSLALYYNKDLFNYAGITNPPKTWEEFNEMSRKLTKVDKFGTITQVGAALGTSANVNRSSDIVTMLMLQFGAKMTDDAKNRAIFNTSTQINGKTVRSGEDALNYYTSFAQSNSPLYTWNSRMHLSLDAFAEGSAAMMINYSWQMQNIKNKNPKLNFAVAELPQMPGGVPANVANYWAFVVAKNKTATAASAKTAIAQQTVPNAARVHEAWEFMKFITMKNSGQITLVNAMDGNSKAFPIKIDPAKEYAKATKKPAARRDILKEQMSLPEVSPFATGNLIAKSWYQPDPDQTEIVLQKMIEVVNTGELDTSHALQLAANRISQLMGK